MKHTSVIVARFQTPYLHQGHYYLVNEIKLVSHKVIVVLGVSPVKGSKRNPFDFYTRERMLKKSYSDLVILPLADGPDDAVWSANLDGLLHDTFPNENFILYGSRDSFIPAYTGALPVKELPEQSTYSATEIRHHNGDKVLDSGDFRLGINYACQNAYAKVYPTVDIAVFKEHGKYLLLGKKKNRNEWRLPGGFVDVEDAGFEAAACRELTEECGAIETGPMQYAGSAQVDDWRYRKEEDKIITTLFTTDYVYGHVQAGDDLVMVEWFAVADLKGMIAGHQIAKEHFPLIDLILKKAVTSTTKELLTQNIKHEN